MYLNKAIIIGNLTRDPETRAMPSGANLASFSVATNRIWKDKTGAKQEDTQFHNVVVFGVQADHCAQYLRKGSSVLVEGRMQTRSWDAGDGAKKYRTEIVADRVTFGPRREGGAGGYNQDTPNQNQSAGKKDGDGAPEGIDYPEEDINPDDIPF